MEDRQLERQRLREQQEVNIAKKMFYAGCAFLPLMWIMSLILFRKRFNDNDASPALRKYLRWSLYGTIIMTCLFITWLIVFYGVYPNHDGPLGMLLIWSPENKWWTW